MRRRLLKNFAVRINVPYYSQTAEFSCGPACANMVLSYFNSGKTPTREAEFEIWRDCNLIGARGADPFGLSIALAKRGINMMVITERVQTFPYERLRKRWGNEGAELATFSIRSSYRRAKGLGVRVVFRKPNVRDAVWAMEKGDVPISLVSMHVVHGFDIPHWVVVTGKTNSGFMINDPYPPKGHKDLEVTDSQLAEMIEGISTKLESSRSMLIASRNIS